VDAIEEVRAIEQIKQLKARYFRCMDKKDWDGLLSVFVADALIDAAASATPVDARGNLIDPPGPDPQWYFTSAKQFVDSMRVHMKDLITVHHGHMPEIALTSPTTASGIWAMEDTLLWPVGAPLRSLHGYGHYLETYERRPEGWRIKTLKLTRVRVDLAQ
jgi:hypothetical protein